MLKIIHSLGFIMVAHITNKSGFCDFIVKYIQILYFLQSQTSIITSYFIGPSKITRI